MDFFSLKCVIRSLFTAVALVSLLSYPGISQATIYQPGETLEPDCAPGSLNCGVATMLDPTDNLSDLADVPTARTNLGLGTLATQSGTFSGTSSGTNTGDQTTITGNAGTATALQTARNINGVPFDGTADITVTAVAEAGTLTGATLAANVLNSSLTSLGTVATGVWNASTIAVNRGGTGTTNGSINGTGALSFTSATFNALTIDSGTTGAVNIGTGTNGAGKTISIGNTNGSTLLNFNAGAGGIYMNGASAADAGHLVLCIDSTTGQLFFGATDATCDPSSVSFKHDIADIALGLDAVNALRPVSYVYNSNNQAKLGFIAEEAAEVDERLVARDSNGVVKAINPDAFTPILTYAIQEMSVLLGETTPGKDMDGESNGLSSLVSAIQSENSRDPIAVIAEKITKGTRLLTDFVSARVTAIRGYFDEVYARKVHTGEVCFMKKNKSEVCVNGDEIDSFLEHEDPSSFKGPLPAEKEEPVESSVLPEPEEETLEGAEEGVSSETEISENEAPSPEISAAPPEGPVPGVHEETETID